MSRRIAAAASLAALALGVAVARAGNREQIKLTAADQSAARAAIVHKSDLGSSWSGGRKKPDLSSSVPPCAGYHPKQSDLVLTGAAKSEFSSTGFDVVSEAQVLRTRRMVALDWQRSVLAPGTDKCLRSMIGKELGSSARLVSFARLAFPRLATYTRAFRFVFDVSASGQKVRVISDIVLVGRSRTELTLTMAAPASAKAALTHTERELARITLARVRA
jgi:hypothetical protein